MPMNVGTSKRGPGFAGVICLPRSVPSRHDSILSVGTHLEAKEWECERTRNHKEAPGQTLCSGTWAVILGGWSRAVEAKCVPLDRWRIN